MRSDLTFGPPGDEWRYDRPSRTYDLARGGGSPAWTVGTSQGPAGTSIRLAPRATALVVVDMQNYFLHPRCRDHPAGLAAAERTERVVEKCRELGVQVIWLNWGLTDDDLAAMPASVQRGFTRSLIQGAPSDDGVTRLGLGADLGDGQGRCLVAGSWNADVYEPLRRSSVRPEDVRCDKNRMSGMWSPEQPLRRYLEGRSGAGAGAAGGNGGEADDDDGGEKKEKEKKKKRTLLFAGVNTDQCVLGTLTDAYNAGWDCVLLEDCCATKTPGAQEVCLYNVAGSYGFVISSETFLAGEAS